MAHLAQLIAELTAGGVALICTSQDIDTSDSNPAGAAAAGRLDGGGGVREGDNPGARQCGAGGCQGARGQAGEARGTLGEHRAAVAGLLAQGKGVREIARELGLPASSAYKLMREIRRAEG